MNTACLITGRPQGSTRIWTIWRNARELPDGHTNSEYPAR